MSKVGVRMRILGTQAIPYNACEPRHQFNLSISWTSKEKKGFTRQGIELREWKPLASMDKGEGMSAALFILKVTCLP